MKALLRPSLASVLVGFFFIILVVLALFAEVFESRTPEVDIAQIYANPVPINEIHQLKSLKITNKNGTFLLENTHPEGSLEGPWQMLEPEALKAKSDVVSKIIDTLNVVRVRNFYKLEPINITSFSLDNPTLTLLFTNIKDKAFEIKMGLINPIDNSAYLSLSSQDQIYQIDPIEMALESYDLTQLAESKVFAINTESFIAFEVQNGNNETLLKIQRKEDGWTDQNGGNLNDGKVRRFLTRLEEMKSYSVLEKLNTDQQSTMEKVVSSPSYRMKLTTTQGTRELSLSEMKGSINGLGGIKNNSYALSSTEGQAYVLIDRDEIRVLLTKPNELK